MTAPASPESIIYRDVRPTGTKVSILADFIESSKDRSCC